MNALGIIVTVIILSLFAKCKIYGKVERFIKKSPEAHVLTVGVLFVSIALLFFLSCTFKIERSYFVRGFDLVFKYNHIFPTLLFLSYILTIFFLIFNKTDRFRYATLFLIVNLILVYIIGFLELPKGRFISNREGLLYGLDILIPLICIIIFGLQSNNTEPKNRFFKFIRQIGARTQTEHDEIERYAKNLSSAPKKYRDLIKAVNIALPVFVVCVILLFLLLSISVLNIQVAYVSLGILVISFVAWLVYFFKKHQL